MSLYLINEETLKGIADAIRTKKGTNELILAENFETEIESLDTETLPALIDRSIASIDIHEGITSIGQAIFWACQQLKKVNMPDSITSIGSYAFYYCSSLESLTFSKNLTGIGSNVFYNCFNCKEFDFSKCKRIPTLGANAFTGITETKILVPEWLYYDWIYSTNWCDYEHFIYYKFGFNVSGHTCDVIGNNNTGASWQNWVDSSYNTLGAYVQDGLVYVDGKPLYAWRGGYGDWGADDILILAASGIYSDWDYGTGGNTYVAFKLLGKWTYGLKGQTLGEWINSVFNNLGAFIITDTEYYWVELPDGTKGNENYTTKEDITNIVMVEGGSYR